MTDKDKWFNLWQPLLIAITVAVISGVVTHFISKDQWQWQLNEKSLENRYELLKETASICSKYQEAREGAIRYAIIFKVMTQDIPKTDTEKLLQIEKKMNDLYPEVYSSYLEASKIFPEIKSQVEIVRTFFGPKTNAALARYVKVTSKMPDEYLDEYIKQRGAHLKKDKIEFEMKEIISKVEEAMDAALSELLASMREELGVRESKPWCRIIRA